MQPRCNNVNILKTTFSSKVGVERMCEVSQLKCLKSCFLFHIFKKYGYNSSLKKKKLKGKTFRKKIAGPQVINPPKH